MSEEKKIEIEESAVRTEPAPEQSSEQKTEQKPAQPAVPPHKEYARRMLSFSSFYVGFIATVVAIMAIAVAVAVLFNVALGVALALFGVLFYTRILSDNMSKTLGFRYVSIVGGIRITMCRARYGDVMWMPEALMGFEVIAIGDAAFKSPKNSELKKVFLPRTLKVIGKDIFEGCEALEDIYYQGSEEEFAKIESETDMSAYRIIFDAKYPPLPKKKKKPAGAAKK